MMKITNEHLEIIWLCFGCPEIMPHSNCVLQKYRDQIVMGKTDMVEELTAIDSKNLIASHEECLQKRTRKELQKSTRCA